MGVATLPPSFLPPENCHFRSKNEIFYTFLHTTVWPEWWLWVQRIIPMVHKEFYGALEKMNSYYLGPRYIKYILWVAKIMSGAKSLLWEHFFLPKKLFFIWNLWSYRSFSAPAIIFLTNRNIYSGYFLREENRCLSFDWSNQDCCHYSAIKQ